MEYIADINCNAGVSERSTSKLICWANWRCWNWYFGRCCMLFSMTCFIQLVKSCRSWKLGMYRTLRCITMGAFAGDHWIRLFFVANALKTSEYDRSEITVHAYACQGKEVMRVRQKVEMHQVNRERNSMVHLLAQLGRTVHTYMDYYAINWYISSLQQRAVVYGLWYTLIHL